MQTYESISFEVEKNLSKPKAYLETTGMKSILDDLYKKQKTGKNPQTGKTIYLKENEPLEILHSTFDINDQVIFNKGKVSLIQGLIAAYKNHYPITVTPDMIWLLFMQGFSRYMEKYGEQVRDKFVDFTGKKDLKVERLEYTPYTATKEVWDGIIREYVQKIGDHVGKETIENFECDFSTTTQAAKVTSQVTIMSAMKQFFCYRVLMGGCGISSITLEGSIEDWKKIKYRMEILAKKGLHWWTKHLIPIIGNIILTKKCYLTFKKVPDKFLKFWKGMIRLKGKGDMYDPHKINGWIVKFIPNLSGNQPTIYEEIYETNVPDQIISCPMELTWLVIPIHKKIEYKCSLASGFYGMVQDKETFNVRPVIGYAIVVEDKKESDTTVEEEKKIIKEFVE